MAKAKTRASLSPESLSLGQPILTADVQTALGAHGYAVGSTIETVISLHCYTNEDTSERWLLQGAGTQIVDAIVWVPPHAQALVVDVDILLGSSSAATAEVTVTVGGASATFTRASSGGAQPGQDTLLTSGTGTGYVALTVEGEVTSGTDAAAALGKLRVATSPIAVGDLADPTVE